jgi:hypothetical protein
LVFLVAAVTFALEWVGQYKAAGNNVELDRGRLFGFSWRGPIALDITDPTVPVKTSSYILCDYGWIGCGYSYAGIDSNNLYFLRHGDVAGAYGFCTVDISDPANLRIISSMEFAGAPFSNNVTPYRGYCFLEHDTTIYSMGPARFMDIIDFHRPDSPWIAGRFDSVGTMEGMAIHDGFGYLHWKGVQTLVLDLADPVHPVVVSHLDVPPGHMFFNGNILYRYSADSLRVYDISNPRAPVLQSSGPLPGNISAVAGRYAFAGVGEAGVQVIDLNDPLRPVAVDTFDTPGRPGKIAVQGNLAFVADGFNQMPVFDISNFSPISRVGTSLTNNGALALAMVNGVLYSAEGYNGLSILPDAGNWVHNQKARAAISNGGVNLQASPNPFNPQTSISYQLLEKARVFLEIYNMSGKHIKTLENGKKSIGHHTLSWKAENVPSGVYLCRLHTSTNVTDTRRTMLLK